MHFTLRMDGTVLSVNPYGAAYLGFPVDELVGLPVFQIIHEADRARFRTHLADCLRTPEQIGQWELRKVKKDGGILWVKESTRVLRWEDQPPLLLVVCEDISTRKRTEDALRQSEERDQLSFLNTQLGICYIDPQGRFLRVNPRFCEIVGYDQQELLGFSITDLTHPDDLASNVRLFGEAVNGSRSTYSLKKRYVHKNGGVRWVQLNATLLRDSEGRPESFFSVVEDITEQKAAQETLAASEQAIRTLYEITSVPNQEYEHQLDALLDLGRRRFGLPVGMLTRVHGDWLEFAVVRGPDGMGPSPGSIPLKDSLCAETLCRPRPLNLPNLGQSPFGNHMARLNLGIEAYLGTTITVNGRSVGTLCFVDILPRSNPFSPADEDFLLLMARWITREVERRQVEDALRQSEHRLRQAFDDRTRISQDLHDSLLQSLYAVGMEFEATKLLIPNRTAKRAARQIDRGLDRLNECVHEVRGFIRSLHAKDHSPKTLHHALEDLIRSFAVGRQRLIHLDCEPDALERIPVTHHGDLLNIVREAVSNSVRHARATETSVTVRLAGPSIRFDIHDNGMGFDPHRPRQGLGLGNMAARAAKLGARYELHSALGTGTIISLYVPLEEK
jgi:PAS domain S-box-containing protein